MASSSPRTQAPLILIHHPLPLFFPTNSSTSHSDSSPTAPIFPVVKYISQDISLKLTTENFLLWKSQVLPVFRTHNLLGFIDGSFPKPSQPMNDVAKWERLDQMVLGWLLGYLSSQILSQVVDKHTTREAWCVFESFYSKLSRARIQQLKSDLMNLQKGTLPIHEYVHQAKSLSLALVVAGKIVDNDDLVLWTLHGLRSEFDSIVAAINSRPDGPPFEEVCGLLLDFELRLNSSSHMQPVVAFTSTSAFHLHPPCRFLSGPLLWPWLLPLHWGSFFWRRQGLCKTRPFGPVYYVRFVVGSIRVARSQFDLIGLVL